MVAKIPRTPSSMPRTGVTTSHRWRSRKTRVGDGAITVRKCAHDADCTTLVGWPRWIYVLYATRPLIPTGNAFACVFGTRIHGRALALRRSMISVESIQWTPAIL